VSIASATRKDAAGRHAVKAPGNWRASLIEALALLSGASFYLMSPVTPVLGALPSPAY